MSCPAPGSSSVVRLPTQYLKSVSLRSALPCSAPQAPASSFPPRLGSMASNTAISKPISSCQDPASQLPPSMVAPDPLQAYKIPATQTSTLPFLAWDPYARTHRTPLHSSKPNSNGPCSIKPFPEPYKSLHIKVQGFQHFLNLFPPLSRSGSFESGSFSCPFLIPLALSKVTAQWVLNKCLQE